MKWPRRLIIVRHGQSEHNVALDLKETREREVMRSIRDMDIALTEEGRCQARETGAALAEYRFDKAFVSPYRRTRQTAEELLAYQHITPYYDERIREKEFGSLHGLTKQGILEQYPDEVRRRQLEGKYWYRLPNGENYPDVRLRLHSFLDMLVRDCAARDVLVVTHHVPCLLFRGLYEHLGEEEILALGDVANCGISEYVCDTSRRPEGRMRLTRWNETVY